MFTEEDLNSAVEAGAIKEYDAERLRAHILRKRELNSPDEETFRLVHNFNDIFVSIGIAIVIVALITLVSETVDEDIATVVAGALVAGLSWYLANIFTLRRRMALPSIILAVNFVGGIALAAFALVDGLGMRQGDFSYLLAAILLATLTTGAAWAHWKRFSVPITMAALITGVILVAGMALFSILYLISETLATISWRWLIFLSGILVFLAAMAWDASDLKRLTYRSDVAFWLHLCAAPLVVHPLFLIVGVSLDTGPNSILSTIAVITISATFMIMALVVDRRALLVSALFYILGSLLYLTKTIGSTADAGLPFALLIVGLGVLALSTAWTKLRSGLLEVLPIWLKAQVPAARKTDKLPSR